MFAIDHEIGIERQHGVQLVDLGHPHNTRIGKRHWSVPIFLVQLVQGGNVLIDVERDAERRIFEEFASCPFENRASRCIASANTGSQTRSGGSNSSTCSTTQR